MADLVASKNKNLVYVINAAKLAANVHSELQLLKAVQTTKALTNFQCNIQSLLAVSLEQVSYSAFISGAKDVEQTIDKTIQLRLKREMLTRSKQASEWITDTTGVSLDISGGMSKSRVASLGRADTIAVNELSLAFFGGTRYGWGLDKTALKTWELSSAHDMDDICDDNYDEGAIGINDVFESGHFIPPAHIKCECDLGLVRKKNVKRRYF